MNDNRSRMMQLLRFGAGIITAIGVVLGVLEYQQRGRMLQARETLDLIDIWDQHGARQAYRELSVALEHLINTEVSEKDKAAARADRMAYRRLRANVSRNLMRDPELANDFEEIIYFFTRLALCIEAELCDEHSAQIFFGDTIDSFLAAFRPSINARQKTVPGFGVPVLDLQQRFAQIVP